MILLLYVAFVRRESFIVSDFKSKHLICVYERGALEVNLRAFVFFKYKMKIEAGSYWVK
jgi:hypothetical protein